MKPSWSAARGAGRHAARADGYFSTIAFHRTKYGRELLVDAAWVREMPTFICDGRPHALSFHEIFLVTRGEGEVRLDGFSAAVAPGTVVFTAPGQLREWRVSGGLDGACLFFTEEFVTETFSDPRFLGRFACFHAHPALQLSPARRRRLLSRFGEMQSEISHFLRDASEALRALLYEVLVWLGRWVAERSGEPAPKTPCSFVERFRGLVERDFARRHLVVEYAAELGVTAGHLSALCRAQERRSAGAVIRSRIALEARRLLLYSDLTAAQVADRLGFADPAYFARFFRREVGLAPVHFRRARIRVGSPE